MISQKIIKNGFPFLKAFGMTSTKQLLKNQISIELKLLKKLFMKIVLNAANLYFLDLAEEENLLDAQATQIATTQEM